MQVEEKGGRHIITKVSENEQKVYSFFGTGPCWFDGCEELREHQKITKAYLANNQDCPMCYKGRILRVLAWKVAQALNYEWNPPSPDDVEFFETILLTQKEGKQ